MNNNVFRVVMIAQVANCYQVEIIVELIEQEFLCSSIVIDAPLHKFLFVKYQFLHNFQYTLLEPDLIEIGCLGQQIYFTFFSFH